MNKATNIAAQRPVKSLGFEAIRPISVKETTFFYQHYGLTDDLVDCASYTDNGKRPHCHLRLGHTPLQEVKRLNGL